MVKGVLVLSVIFWVLIVLLVKGSGLPRRRVQSFLHMLFRTQSQGTQRRGDGKDCFLLPPKEKGERWACLAIFFLALGLGDFALGNAWNLLSEATGVGGSSWTVQPKRLAHWSDGRGALSAAKRRRERRLRCHWKHECLSVRMAVAAARHHSRGREGVEGGTYDAPRRQKPPPPGRLPAPLSEVGGRQEVLVRHSGKQLIDDLPSVQILDAPMPQVAGTVLDFCRTLDLPVDEQVITVPKFSPERVPQRLVERCFPQLAEQLVEVPTVLSYSLLQQRISAQQKEEEEELEAARRQLLSLFAVPPPLRTAEQLSRIQDCNGVIRRTRRKKKRKKKLPRAPRPRCGRPCARQ